ncbi:MAG: hypothetical protein AAGF12_36985, partial [Myxococcota bacterium]
PRSSLQTPTAFIVQNMFISSLVWILGVEEAKADSEFDAQAPEVVEAVIEDMGGRLPLAIQDKLRGLNWHGAEVSYGTVRSYAMDLLMGGEPMKVGRRSGRLSVVEDDG